MIGVAAYFKYQKGVFLKNNLPRRTRVKAGFDRLDRVARPDLKVWSG
jgi:hypothetical protein